MSLRLSDRYYLYYCIYKGMTIKDLAYHVCQCVCVCVCVSVCVCVEGVLRDYRT